MPNPDSCTAADQALFALFDHLVGAGEQRGRYFQLNLFCRLLVQDEFEMSGLLHGKILRSFTPQDANHVGCTAMVHVNELGSVANQSTRINIASSRVRYRDRITDRQRDDLIAQSLITTFL